jgi:hypothetical protein
MQAFDKGSTSISARAIETGVTETREFRGVVAGPRNVAIQEVGTDIRAGFERPTELLVLILDAIEIGIRQRPEDQTGPPPVNSSPAAIQNRTSAALA